MISVISFWSLSLEGMENTLCNHWKMGQKWSDLIYNGLTLDYFQAKKCDNWLDDFNILNTVNTFLWHKVLLPVSPVGLMEQLYSSSPNGQSLAPSQTQPIGMHRVEFRAWHLNSPAPQVNAAKLRVGIWSVENDVSPNKSYVHDCV